MPFINHIWGLIVLTELIEKHGLEVIIVLIEKHGLKVIILQFIDSYEHTIAIVPIYKHAYKEGNAVLGYISVSVLLL